MKRKKYLSKNTAEELNKKIRIETSLQRLELNRRYKQKSREKMKQKQQDLL